jgi:formate hydrogenlyase transcriptional activator
MSDWGPGVQEPISHLLPEDAQSLFEASPDGILITDSSGVIRGANARLAELFQYSQNELLGKRMEELVPARFRTPHLIHRENFNAHPRARRMGAAQNLSGLRKDGSEFPVDIMLMPRETASGVVVLSYIRDISDLRSAQEELRRSDQQLSAMIEGVHSYAIYLLDTEGHFVTWNSGAEQILQYSADEIRGLHFSRLHTAEDQAQNQAAELMRMAADRGRVEVQAWRVRKDGSRFWADVTLIALRDSSSQITGYASVTRDLTDRKQAEESMMLQLTTALLANVEVHKLLDAITASVRAVVRHDRVELALYDASAGNLAVQSLGVTGPQDQHGEVRLSLRNSPAGAAFRTRQPLRVERISDSSFDPESMRHLVSLGMQSGIWVPLPYNGDAIGVVGVFSRTIVAFSQHDADVLVQLANLIGMAVGNTLTTQSVSNMRDRLRQEKQYLESQMDIENRYEDIIGKSPALVAVLKHVESVAPTESTVLIEGETGTGKELLARAIHRLSPRKERSFIKLNCAAIPSGLIESELFGHEKGAFTGAIARKIGLLELAQEGTLFLDEIGELPPELQPKLLRALQEREITRLGGSRPIFVNIRLIAATNRDLARMVASREFRSDLFYRLRVFPLRAPALRERVSDIPILVRHFVAVHARRMGKNIQIIPDATMDALVRWKWPGNIRELENFLERSVILTHGPVLHVPLAELRDDGENAPLPPAENPTLRQAERDHIAQVLRDVKGNVSDAAERLGVKRTTLYSKLKKLAIQQGDFI